jgi:hypothetical protein
VSTPTSVPCTTCLIDRLCVCRCAMCMKCSSRDRVIPHVHALEGRVPVAPGREEGQGTGIRSSAARVDRFCYIWRKGALTTRRRCALILHAAVRLGLPQVYVPVAIAMYTYFCIPDCHQQFPHLCMV